MERISINFADVVLVQISANIRTNFFCVVHLHIMNLSMRGSLFLFLHGEDILDLKSLIRSSLSHFGRGYTFASEGGGGLGS